MSRVPGPWHGHMRTCTVAQWRGEPCRLATVLLAPGTPVLHPHMHVSSSGPTFCSARFRVGSHAGAGPEEPPTMCPDDCVVPTHDRKSSYIILSRLRGYRHVPPELPAAHRDLPAAALRQPVKVVIPQRPTGIPMDGRTLHTLSGYFM